MNILHCSVCGRRLMKTGILKPPRGAVHICAKCTSRVNIVELLKEKRLLTSGR